MAFAPPDVPSTVSPRARTARAALPRTVAALAGFAAPWPSAGACQPPSVPGKSILNSVPLPSSLPTEMQGRVSGSIPMPLSLTGVRTKSSSASAVSMASRPPCDIASRAWMAILIMTCRIGPGSALIRPKLGCTFCGCLGGQGAFVGCRMDHRFAGAEIAAPFEINPGSCGSGSRSESGSRRRRRRESTCSAIKPKSPPP